VSGEVALHDVIKKVVVSFRLKRVQAPLDQRQVTLASKLK
jgi:hypothetical protein